MNRLFVSQIPRKQKQMKDKEIQQPKQIQMMKKKFQKKREKQVESERYLSG